MIISPTIPFHRLVLSLSEGLDHVDPQVADHQLRVAHMSTAIARMMGFSGETLRDIFYAAALHDIGLIRASNRVRSLTAETLEGIEWHSEVGYLLLCGSDFFVSAAPIVRYHHAIWAQGKTLENVPLGSYVVALADKVDRLIQRDVPILRQRADITKKILAGRGTEFHPDCVDAFREVAGAPAFWLDTVSKRIYSILVSAVD